MPPERSFAESANDAAFSLDLTLVRPTDRRVLVQHLAAALLADVRRQAPSNPLGKH